MTEALKVDAAAFVGAKPPPAEPTEQEKKLAELKARRASLEEAQAQRTAERSIQDEIEEQEIAIRDAEAIAKAEAEHGTLGKKIGAVKTPGIGIVIVKRPNHVAFRRWSDTYAGKAEGIPDAALEELVRPCLVHPDGITLDHYIMEQPALLQRVANVVTKLAGMRGQELAGK